MRKGIAVLEARECVEQLSLEGFDQRITRGQAEGLYAQLGALLGKDVQPATEANNEDAEISEQHRVAAELDKFVNYLGALARKHLRVHVEYESTHYAVNMYSTKEEFKSDPPYADMKVNPDKVS